MSHRSILTCPAQQHNLDSPRVPDAMRLGVTGARNCRLNEVNYRLLQRGTERSLVS